MLTIRSLDGQVKEQLRLRAARNGRSMQDEARSILAATLVAEAMKTSTWPKRFVAASRRSAASSWSLIRLLQ